MNGHFQPIDYRTLETRVTVACPPVMHPPTGDFRLAGCFGTWLLIPAETTREELSRYFNVVLPQPPIPSVQPKTLTVAGSRGASYTVRLRENGQTSCTCPGFGFRRTCKHLAALSA